MFYVGHVYLTVQFFFDFKKIIWLITNIFFFVYLLENDKKHVDVGKGKAGGGGGESKADEGYMNEL